MPLRADKDPGGHYLAAIVDGSPVATFVLDAQHRVTHWNRACEMLTGVKAQDIIGTSDQWRAFYPQQRAVLADLAISHNLDEIKQLYRGKYNPSQLIPGAFEAEDFFPHFGEGGRWLFFTAAPIHDTEGKVVGAVETLQDVTERRRAEARLRESEAVFAQIVDGSSVATFVIDRDHHVTHWNRACEALTGVPAHDIIGTQDQWRAFYDEKRPVMADIILDGAREAAISEYYHGKFRPSKLIRGAFEAEDFFPAFGDSGKWVFFTAAPLRNPDGLVIGAIETLQDITQRKQAETALKKSEERYRQMSQVDDLTQLFNSRHFYDRLAREIDRASRYHRPLSLLMIDADHFKKVNDTYGHLEGDRVLQNLARCIEAALRGSDSAYRYGGEEFVVIMPESSGEGAYTVAERIRQQFSELPMRTEAGVDFHCTVSIGIAQYLAGDTPTSFIHRADKAAYGAKERGRNCVAMAH